MPALLDLGLATFAGAVLVVLLADLVFALAAAAFAATFTMDKYPFHKQLRKTYLLGVILRASCLLGRRLLHSGSLLGSRGSLLRGSGGFLGGRGLFRRGLSLASRCLLCRSSLCLRRFLRSGTLLGGLCVLHRIE